MRRRVIVMTTEYKVEFDALRGGNLSDSPLANAKLRTFECEAFENGYWCKSTKETAYHRFWSVFDGFEAES